MQSIIVLILLLSLCVSVGSAANILGIFTSTGPSHIIIHMATVKALVEKGHNVTLVTILPLKDHNPGYHHIHVPSSVEDSADYRQTLSNAATGGSNFESIKHLLIANVQRVQMQEKAIRHPRFQELLNNKGNHFDVVILGLVFNTFQLGIAAHFKCPVIVSWINVPSKLVLSFVGNPLALSSVPILVFNSSQQMNFPARVKNFLSAGAFMALESFSEFKMEQYYEKHFPTGLYPTYDEMKRNVSLVFCNTHFSEGLIRPIVPGFVEIGGIQVKERPAFLPKDIHHFLKTAHNGFILFTMGTNVNSSDMAANTTMAVFNVLSNLKLKVLWKWDNSEPPGKSANIMFRKWLPQDDLLAHSKMRLFITHAGKASVVEAQYHGVPMLAIPMLGDQFGIAQRMVAMGYGLMLDHLLLTENSFRHQLQEVLGNSKYLEAVLKFSMLYRDRPMSPKQSVVYWTEYVIRHRGAGHMQSPAVHMNIFQRTSLDVMGFLVIVLYLSYLLLKSLLKLVGVLIFRKKLKVD